MERLMQYVWQHRLWMPGDMQTVDGQRVEVLDPGLLNTDAGPDFFNAKVRIGSHEWAGNVEIHVRASDWVRHGHQADPAYDSIILHVVYRDDYRVHRADGSEVPQLVMACAPDLNEKYRAMVESATAEPPCAAQIPGLPQVYLTDWLSALAFERIEERARRMLDYARRSAFDWHEAIYIMLARGLGFSTNSDAFERLALALPLRYLLRHQNNIETIEGACFGMAGLLDGAKGGEDYEDRYIATLWREYKFFIAKYRLVPQASLGWRLARMRPQNFPHRRLGLLAQMVSDGFMLGYKLLSVRTLNEARSLFDCRPSYFWQTHYTFAPSNGRMVQTLSDSSVLSLIINVVVPVMFAYGIHQGQEEYRQRAIDLLEQIPAEDNKIVRSFTAAGVPCPDAFTSQAIIELRRNYCDKRKCLYCRIGHRYLAANAIRH